MAAQAGQSWVVEVEMEGFSESPTKSSMANRSYTSIRCSTIGIPGKAYFSERNSLTELRRKLLKLSNWQTHGWVTGQPL